MSLVKCAVCGNSVEVGDNEVVSSLFPISDLGNKYLYDLWHKIPYNCNRCGYTSFDISRCMNKDIINDSQFLNVDKNPFVLKLDNYGMTFLVREYLRAGAYYNKINDLYREGISYLLAWDEVNKFLLYYSENVSEDNTKVLDKVEIQFEQFAKSLFDYGVSRIEIMYEKYPDNVDITLLYVNMLLVSDKSDIANAGLILKNMNINNLSVIQRKAKEILDKKYSIKSK